MKNPYINLLIKSWHFAGEKRFSFVMAIGLFIIANFFVLAQPYLFGQVLNTLQKGGPNLWYDFLFFLVLYSLLPLGFWIFHGFGRVIERTAAFYVGKNVREYIFGIITDLPFAWHSDNHSGETINKISKSSNAIERFSGRNFLYIETIIRFVGSLAAIAFMSGYLSIVAIIVGLVIIGIIRIFDRGLVIQQKIILAKEHKVAALLHDYISNIRTVITLHFEELARHELMIKMLDIFPTKKQNFILTELKWFSASMLINILGFGIIFAFAYNSLRDTGIILAGNLVILFQYLEKFSESFYSFAGNYEEIVQLNSELQTLNPIIEEHEKFLKVSHTLESESWKKIGIENWNFSYGSGGEKHTLKNISLEIRKGARIALIGESGSGKSTMASLIKGLYAADTGNLDIDGQDYENLSVLSKITTLIPQDPEIFENTLTYNVTFGIETLPEHIDEAIRLARFDSVLSRLPGGLETNIKEKGVNLSGGEKQRLALARGLFMARNRDIIIMDEPTSSVDPANEIAIYKNIFKQYPDKSIISAIHRLHLLPMFDMIHLFDQGEVIESGTFEELLARGGKFSGLWKQYMEASK